MILLGFVYAVFGTSDETGGITLPMEPYPQCGALIVCCNPYNWSTRLNCKIDYEDTCCPDDKKKEVDRCKCCSYGLLSGNEEKKEMEKWQIETCPKEFPENMNDAAIVEEYDLTWIVKLQIEVPEDVTDDIAAESICKPILTALTEGDMKREIEMGKTRKATIEGNLCDVDEQSCTKNKPNDHGHCHLSIKLEYPNEASAKEDCPEMENGDPKEDIYNLIKNLLRKLPEDDGNKASYIQETVEELLTAEADKEDNKDFINCKRLAKLNDTEAQDDTGMRILERHGDHEDDSATYMAL